MTDSTEISQESLAPLTELSHQPPPILPIPPTPNSTPSTAPPPPPSNSIPTTKTTDGRPILRPVAPSKHPIPEKPPSNSSKNSDIANAFLPQVLTEIIATRQRRERAWQARLMICTTVISSIDNTLAIFTKDEEKEEIVVFKAYLNLAIANFAATDLSPPPPLVTLHSRPNKVNRNENSKEKSKDKKFVKDSNIDLPRFVENNDKSWATVARKGQKKARVVQNNNNNNNNIHVDTRNKEKQRVSHKDSSSASALDKRLFVRISQEHEWRKLSPAGIREVIVKKLLISPSLFGKIKPVNSGSALSPSNTEARETILKAGNGLFLSGAKLEPASNWIPILILTIPSTIRLEQGQIDVNNTLLADEIERVCSVRPAHLKLYGRNETSAPHRTWIAYFTKAPPGGFRAFDESGITRPFKKPQPLQFCKRCNGHHPAKNCSRAPSCDICGSTNDSGDTCMAATKCRNCGGPHRSDSRRSLARLTRSGAPSKEQMKVYRQVGNREYQAVLRAKAAEENAASSETVILNAPNSQISEVNSSAVSSHATPVDSSTCVASRL
ncbi:putative eka-like protein [Erysiphe necator]|uniref:Putative eka-like protein n=1 Tax=Uncinula necator TaxID=52586 RepID=A0A0B1PB29_UNCNE|nr:putative eka-like protein [Erysiphe necator]